MYDIVETARLEFSDALIATIDAQYWLRYNLRTSNVPQGMADESAKKLIERTITLWADRWPIAVICDELEKEIARRLRKLTDSTLVTGEVPFDIKVLYAIRSELYTRIG